MEMPRGVRLVGAVEAVRLPNGSLSLGAGGRRCVRGAVAAPQAGEASTDALGLTAKGTPRPLRPSRSVVRGCARTRTGPIALICCRTPRARRARVGENRWCAVSSNAAMAVSPQASARSASRTAGQPAGPTWPVPAGRTRC